MFLRVLMRAEGEMMGEAREGPSTVTRASSTAVFLISLVFSD